MFVKLIGGPYADQDYADQDAEIWVGQQSLIQMMHEGEPVYYELRTVSFGKGTRPHHVGVFRGVAEAFDKAIETVKEFDTELGWSADFGAFPDRGRWIKELIDEEVARRFPPKLCRCGTYMIVKRDLTRHNPIPTEQRSCPSCGYGEQEELR